VKKTLIALVLFSTPLLAQQSQRPDLEEVFFKQFDTNQDGQVSKAEFLKPTEDQFAHMDRNSDGSLDRAEVAAFNAEMEKRMLEMRQRMQQQGQGPQGMPRR
jgi:Ca2+-binding EF-hand superfamily protein